ncbi:hypothetical protein PVK06_008165 [Gossypium arboreum]|uniref:Uncharacterized protein n=1 Tax=Gossypium arboreum TaxID=29729 RepID=A0ABR0QJ98_GOSAR|nr:hypothetical protein PVK06_008165 [Gossypium arboreum]
MEQGNYMACFSAPEHWPLITLTIDFDWKTGVQFKDWFNVAKKGHVDRKRNAAAKSRDYLQNDVVVLRLTLFWLLSCKITILVPKILLPRK